MVDKDNWQARIREVLKSSAVFGQLHGSVFDELIESLTCQPVAGGTRVIREGDEADSVIIVISGRLRVWREANDGTYMRYNEIGPGESIGEPGMILRQKRTANASALRDSLLAVLSRQAFENLLTRQPLDINRAFSQSLYNYLRHTPQSSAGHTCKSYAVIPLHPDGSADSVANSLIATFTSRGRARHISHTDELGLAASAFRIDENIGRLDELERCNDFLVFVTTSDMSAWTLKAIHQSDQIIFVAAAHTDSRPTELEHQLADIPGFEMKRKHFVLLHPAGAERPAAIAAWRTDRDIERYYPLRADNPDDFSRLARFLTDSAVGVVLGGGGARGFAHIGVLRALEEARQPIDLLGGNSMGALIGAQYIAGVPLDEIGERTRKFALGGEYPTLPFVSLLSGRRMERDLKRMFGDTTNDRLWRPFFAAACNLSQANTTIQDSGPLWRTIMASNSPAGLLPPVIHDGNLLVDGAILDNVPVAAMRTRLGTPLEQRRGNGTIIAVDVEVRDELGVAPDVTRLSALDVLKASLGIGTRQYPGIGDILYRAGHIGSLRQRARTSAMAERYLEPPVAGFSLMAYRQAEAIIEVGYRYAVAEIERWNCP